MKRIDFKHVMLVYDVGELVDAIQLDSNEKWNKKTVVAALGMVGFNVDPEKEEIIDEVVDALLYDGYYHDQESDLFYTINDTIPASNF